MNKHIAASRLNLALTAVLGVATAAFCLDSHAVDLGVSASVADNCNMTTSNVAFGAYDPISGSAKTGTGTIHLTCTNGASANVTLGQGMHPAEGSSDSAPLRQMTGAVKNDSLAYFLYQDTESTVWGNTSGTGAASSGTGSNVDLTIYGSIPAGQTSVRADSYSDTVVASVSF